MLPRLGTNDFMRSLTFMLVDIILLAVVAKYHVLYSCTYAVYGWYWYVVVAYLLISSRYMHASSRMNVAQAGFVCHGLLLEEAARICKNLQESRE